MKLALIAKVWCYDALYDSCKARIIADPLSHVSSPLWKSQVLNAGVPELRTFFFPVIDMLTLGLTTEVLVALPAHTVIAIDEMKLPQVRLENIRPKHPKSVTSVKCQTTQNV